MELFIHDEKQMKFSEKWMELEIFMLSEIKKKKKNRKASAAPFLPCVKYKFKFVYVCVCRSCN